MSMCADCGRLLGTCEYCGTADVLTVDGETYPVVTEPGWGGGRFHRPCRDAEQDLLKAGR